MAGVKWSIGAKGRPRIKLLGVFQKQKRFQTFHTWFVPVHSVRSAWFTAGVRWSIGAQRSTMNQAWPLPLQPPC
eukprot:m.238782 g.238782  ORF g.238782 m.238782 type:complete len:74 (+) comp18970_c1_seq1:9-230(+)